MKFEMKLKPIYFDKIKSGKKTFEVRLYDEKRKKINVGDELVFKKEPECIEEIRTKVEELLVFESFEKLMQMLPLNKMGFESMSKDAVLEEYYKFYSNEDELKYGVVAIRIKLQG